MPASTSVVPSPSRSIKVGRTPAPPSLGNVCSESALDVNAASPEARNSMISGGASGASCPMTGEPEGNAPSVCGQLSADLGCPAESRTWSRLGVSAIAMSSLPSRSMSPSAGSSPPIAVPPRRTGNPGRSDPSGK